MAHSVKTNGKSTEDSSEKIVAQKAGLEDIVVGTSSICFIDGKKGRLVYRGYDVNDLVDGGACFEEVIYLLWFGRLPNKHELSSFSHKLAARRRIPREVIAHLYSIPVTASPMEALRTAVSELALYQESIITTPEARLDTAMHILSQIATIIAFDDRIRREQNLIMPDPELSFAANFLYMLTGKVPDEEVVRFFDICMILHADHEFNASTFSARVISATLSDMYSAITGAIGALKGPLHGGANEQVMKMLFEIGDTSRVDGYIHKHLEEKRKIMGFGHRVYKTEDPRARHLKEMALRMGERTGQMKWYDMSRRIEHLMLEERKLYPNVDFYSGSVYHLMGISDDLFTPIFAASRASGWIAHILEQYSNNRLIRPTADYIGPKDQKFVSIDHRS